MNNFRIIRACSSALAILAAGPVAAADLTPPPLAPAPPAPSSAWDGFYLGTGLGGSFEASQFARPKSNLAKTSIGGFDGGPDISLFAGYNWQGPSRWVLGAEGQFTFLSVGHYRELGPTLDFLQHSPWVASATGRIGVETGTQSLIYGKLGPALIDVSGNTGFVGTFNSTLPAVQGGFGVETMLTPLFGLRAEADYTHAVQDLSLNAGTDRYRPNIMTVMVGGVFHFGPHVGAANAPPIPAPRWTGLEVGGDLSINGDEMHYQDTSLGETGPLAIPALGGGGFVALNWQAIPQAVIGVEASGNYQNANLTTGAGSSGFYGTFYKFASLGGDLALSARAGWLATPDTLLYGRVGAASMQVKTDYGYWNNYAPNPTGTRYMPALLTGFGMETFVTSNLSVRVEGDWYSATNPIVFNGTVTPREFTLRPSMVSANTGLAWHF
jgi:outer membrane immunogenic protein